MDRSADRKVSNVVHDYTEETDKDHGRLDLRRYWVTEELSTLSDTARWSALAASA
jgi:hypothetical protein